MSNLNLQPLLAWIYCRENIRLCFYRSVTAMLWPLAGCLCRPLARSTVTFASSTTVILEKSLFSSGDRKKTKRRFYKDAPPFPAPSCWQFAAHAAGLPRRPPSFRMRWLRQMRRLLVVKDGLSLMLLLLPGSHCSSSFLVAPDICLDMLQSFCFWHQWVFCCSELSPPP